MGAQTLTQQSVGSAILQPNEVLTTTPGGKTEILLTLALFCASAATARYE